MIDLGGLLDFFWVVLVVRYGVMTIGHANRAIAAVATFARDHAADNAGHVGLIRDHDEIHHQSRVIVKLLRDGTRSLHDRQLHSCILLFSFLNAALNVTNSF